MSRPKQCEFECRVVFQSVEILCINRLVVFCKEHCFAFTKRAGRREQPRSDGAILGNWRRHRPAGRRLSQSYLGGIEVRSQLHS